MNHATFYHAGCPVCVSAEQSLLDALDRNQYKIDIIHLGEQPQHIDAADTNGVKSVPALLIDGQVLHINYGASLADLRSST